MALCSIPAWRNDQEIEQAAVEATDPARMAAALAAIRSVCDRCPPAGGGSTCLRCGGFGWVLTAAEPEVLVALALAAADAADPMVRVPRDWSVRITDDQMGATVTPRGAASYLRERGWMPVLLGALGDIYRRGDARVFIPSNPAAGDYGRRIRCLLEDLARIENRSPVEVLTDLRAASSAAARR